MSFFRRKKSKNEHTPRPASELVDSPEAVPVAAGAEEEVSVDEFVDTEFPGLSEDSGEAYEEAEAGGEPEDAEIYVEEADVEDVTMAPEDVGPAQLMPAESDVSGELPDPGELARQAAEEMEAQFVWSVDQEAAGDGNEAGDEDEEAEVAGEPEGEDSGDFVEIPEAPEDEAEEEAEAEIDDPETKSAGDAEHQQAAGEDEGADDFETESREDAIRLLDEEYRNSEELSGRVAELLGRLSAGSETGDGAGLGDVEALVSLLEARYEELRGEEARLQTMRSLAEMEIGMAREQAEDNASARESVSEELEALRESRAAADKSRQAAHLEHEKAQAELVEAARARAGAVERESRAELELEKAQEIRDESDRIRNELFLKESALASRTDEIERRIIELEKREATLEAQEKTIKERSDLAEEQRRRSLEILEGATELRRSSERALRDANQAKDEMIAERDSFEKSRLEAEEKRSQYENEFAETTRLKAQVAEEMEKAEHVRYEAERERDVMASELERKIGEADAREKKAQEEVRAIRQQLVEAEKSLGQSERERHDLRSEVTRLEGQSADYEIQKAELREARQWVSRARELEDEIRELRLAKGLPKDSSAPEAADAVQSISDALGQIEGGDPEKLAQIHGIVSDLMAVASGEEKLVEIQTAKAQDLIEEMLAAAGEGQEHSDQEENPEEAEAENPEAPEAEESQPAADEAAEVVSGAEEPDNSQTLEEVVAEDQKTEGEMVEPSPVYEAEGASEERPAPEASEEWNDVAPAVDDAAPAQEAAASESPGHEEQPLPAAESVEAEQYEAPYEPVFPGAHPVPAEPVESTEPWSPESADQELGGIPDFPEPIHPVSAASAPEQAAGADPFSFQIPPVDVAGKQYPEDSVISETPAPDTYTPDPGDEAEAYIPPQPEAQQLPDIPVPEAFASPIPIPEPEDELMAAVEEIAPESDLGDSFDDLERR